MTKEVLSAIQDAVGTQVFGIWFLIGAALVFFMHLPVWTVLFHCSEL